MNSKVIQMLNFIAAVIATVLLCSNPVTGHAQNSQDTPITLDNFKVPEYGDSSDEVPEMMIYGRKATTRGVVVDLEDLKLEWLDGAINKIKATITTPFGVYDRASKIIKGDRPVHFRSNSMDVDGIGFEADQTKKMVHINSNAKVVLKGDLRTISQQTSDIKLKKD